MKRTILFFLAVIFLASCASPATPAVTKTTTTTSTPTQTPTPAPTNTPTIAPTKIPEVISPDNASRLVRYAVLGHEWLRQAAVSPDHKTIAIANVIGVTFYNAETLEKIKTIETSGAARIISFSPDGTKLAIRLVIHGKTYKDDKGVLEIWDVKTSSRLSHYDDVTPYDALIFSPDGCQVISWGKNVYNICDNNTTQKSAEDWRNPSAVFSPNGTRALVFVGGERWTLWDIQQNKKVRDIKIKASLNFDGEKYSGGLPIYSPDGKAIASYKADEIYLTDSTEFAQLAKYKVSSAIKSLQYSPDGKYLLVFGKDGKFHLLSAATGEQLGESDEIPYVPVAVTFSPDSKFVTSLDDYININRWKVPEMKLDKTQTYLPLTQPAVFSDLTNYMAIRSSGYSLGSEKDFPTRIAVFDANTLEQKYLLEVGTNDFVGGLAFSPDGKILASTDKNVVKLWDMTTGKMLQQMLKGSKEMEGVAFSPDGTIIAAVDMWAYKLFLWNVSSGELIDSYTLSNPIGRGFYPNAVYFTNNSQVVINRQFIWDLEKKEWMKNFIGGGIPNPAKTLYVQSFGCTTSWDDKNLPLNEFCVTTSNDVYGNTAEGKIFTGKTYSDFDKFVFNPSGHILLQASDTGLVILWKIKP